jgi:hypothetical protein
MKNLREQASKVLGREVKGEALSVTIRSLIEKVKEKEEETLSAKEFLVQSRTDLKRYEMALNHITSLGPCDNCDDYYTAKQALEPSNE